MSESKDSTISAVTISSISTRGSIYSPTATQPIRGERRLICGENFKNIDDDMTQVAAQLNHLRSMGLLSFQQIVDANRALNENQDPIHLSTMKLWITMNLEDQVRFAQNCCRR
ncbi:uncharacterized protein LOC131654135 [Vicia villosa]|uniref:uncharacterized protein LOC131654135 n=1 Tax=Vicia villosa TaxID=3911 RepID=UPI00273AD90B|nr:uncharacterized protein LOC131654135 [Vicia villosa]